MPVELPIRDWEDRASRPRTAAQRPGEPWCETGTPCEIAKAMGTAGWNRLKPAIRRRFRKLSDHAGTVTYLGTMRSVRCSNSGMVLAQFSRLVGTPLAPYRGRNIKTEVAVYADKKRRGMVWDRRYTFPGQPVLSVRSTKVLDTDNKLLECVGGGFGMELRVFERAGALHFLSERYFWEFLGFRIHLPDLLTPGRAHVVHTDLGEGLFRFEITMQHRQLGETFYQVGEFRDVEDQPTAGDQTWMV